MGFSVHGFTSPMIVILVPNSKEFLYYYPIRIHHRCLMHSHFQLDRDRQNWKNVYQNKKIIIACYFYLNYLNIFNEIWFFCKWNSYTTFIKIIYQKSKHSFYKLLLLFFIVIEICKYYDTIYIAFSKNQGGIRAYK